MLGGLCFTVPVLYRKNVPIAVEAPNQKGVGRSRELCHKWEGMGHLYLRPLRLNPLFFNRKVRKVQLC